MLKLAYLLFSRHNSTLTDGHNDRHAKEPVCVSSLIIRDDIPIQERLSGILYRSSEPIGMGWNKCCFAKVKGCVNYKTGR